MQEFLIKHIREYDTANTWGNDNYSRGKPFATIAICSNGIGVSVCNKKDHFTKHRGTYIACERAFHGYIAKIPNEWRLYYNGENDEVEYLHVEDIIEIEVEKLERRWNKMVGNIKEDTNV